MMRQKYDSLGKDYKIQRKPDHRIKRFIFNALGNAETVLNVGAGTGAYEPLDRKVVAIEPSKTMIKQRSKSTAPIIQASSQHLPFRDSVFDAVMALLTIHHWPDIEGGLREMVRVTRQHVVIFTWDPSSNGFWLVRDYFPRILDIDRKSFPGIEMIGSFFRRISVQKVAIPYDCTDGFLGAYWRRPYEYLKPDIRKSISTFNNISPDDNGFKRLEQDLSTGEWDKRYYDLLGKSSLDIGYRIIAAEIESPS